nr:GGDEF domain-containing protein [uncultured Pseudomonas sp.]
MPENEIPSTAEAFALWREAQDTRVRTRLGGVYYLTAWILTWLFSNTPTEQMPLGVGASLVFTALLSLRLRHHLPRGADSLSLRRWLNRHWYLIALTGLCWGLLHAWTLSNPAFSDSRLIATLSTIAFSTAMAYNFSMDKNRAMLTVALLYLPGLLAMGLDWHERLGPLTTLAFYLSYLLLVINRSHGEYRNTLTLELKLLEQQARLEHLSRTDSLTQLGNRHEFNTLFPALIDSAQQRSAPLSLVLLDIDFFKRINDEFGHACGDAYLSAFAARMRHVFRRDSDTLLRLGGEEFGVLMPNTALEQARRMAESFIADLAAHPLEVPGSSLSVSASIGVGCFDPKRDASPEALFKRVDDALYLAKKTGRNRLILASD